MRRLAIMADAVDPQTMLERNTVRALASKFGIDPIPLEIRRTEDIEPAILSKHLQNLPEEMTLP